jgi:hypothetical protein
MIDAVQRSWIVAAALGLTLVGTAAARSGGTTGAVDQPRTLVVSSGRIVAFAQDGERIGWLVSGVTDCLDKLKPLRMLDLSTGAKLSLPLTQPLCHDLGGPFGLGHLAVAGRRALWTMVFESNTETDGAFISAALDDPKGKIACDFSLGFGTEDSYSPTLFAAGDGRTFVVASDLNARLGGNCLGLEVVDARGRASEPPALRAARTTTRLAVGAGRIALSAPPFNAVQLRSARSGGVVRRIAVKGTVRALALSRSTVAVLVDAKAGRRLEFFAVQPGRSLGQYRVPPSTAPEISVAATVVVFHAGRSIYVLDGDRGTIRFLATATSTPIGLSIEGPRVAWAENAHGRGRIEAVTLRRD